MRETRAPERAVAPHTDGWMVKSKRMTLVGHVACMRRKQKSLQYFGGKTRRKESDGKTEKWMVGTTIKQAIKKQKWRAEVYLSESVKG